MKKIVLLILVLASVLAGYSQKRAASNFVINYNLAVPISSDFVQGLSPYGATVGYNQGIAKGLTVGLELGWNTRNKYYDRMTDYTKDGAVTTDKYKSLFTLPITATVTKDIFPGRTLIPYGKLGVGTLYSEQRVYYNIYEEDNHNWGFTVIPEIGVRIKTRKTSPWAFNAGVQYRYATNSVDDYHINNIQSVNFNAGISWLLR
ncbi:outer membrane beta-barrel protein [Paraflavitalea pollutisoli]|uniref:outer membrane beta-barrel protein n=1 Tax=Paraflavitalea pollutisoli TaxID=3034143 RepID=UPI0023ED58E9|nr:outer membrane beta-barrel protein [Paraflavitalea sp. H1-2-19X]